MPVAGEIRCYNTVPSPGDKLASPKEVSVKGLLKRDYVGEWYKNSEGHM